LVICDIDVTSAPLCVVHEQYLSALEKMIRLACAIGLDHIYRILEEY